MRYQTTVCRAEDQDLQAHLSNEAAAKAGWRLLQIIVSESDYYQSRPIEYTCIWEAP